MCSLQFVWRHAYGLGCLVLATMLTGAGARAGSVPMYTLTDLGTLPGASDSLATGLNDHGDVVGSSDTAAFLYSGGKMVELTPLLGNAPLANTAVGINDSGQVIGVFGGLSTTASWIYSGGKLTPLSTLAMSTYATGINVRGQVTGDSSFNFGEGIYHAFLYSDGTEYDLSSLVVGAPGYVLEDANGINESGQIAGTALTPSGATHAVVLTPTATAIPLPPAAWAALTAPPLLLLGGRLIAGRASSKRT